MSMDKHIYLGYYFDIKYVEIKNTVKYNGCPTCMKHITTPFCSKCGPPHEKGLERIESYKADAYDLCEELGKEWGEYITGTDPITGKNDNICVINRNNKDSIHMGYEDHFTHDFIDQLPPSMTETTKKFVDIVKERFGEDSIKVHYGLVIWYS